MATTMLATGITGQMGTNCGKCGRPRPPAALPAVLAQLKETLGRLRAIVPERPTLTDEVRAELARPENRDYFAYVDEARGVVLTYVKPRSPWEKDEHAAEREAQPRGSVAHSSTAEPTGPRFLSTVSPWARNEGEREALQRELRELRAIADNPATLFVERARAQARIGQLERELGEVDLQQTTVAARPPGRVSPLTS